MSWAHRKKAKRMFINSNWILILFYSSVSNASVQTLQIPKAWSHFRTPWFFCRCIPLSYESYWNRTHRIPFLKNLLISNHWKIKANKPNAIVYCVMLESTARASEPQDWINWINCLLRKIFINIKLMLINASSFQILVAFIRQLFKAVFIPYGAYVVVNILVTM